MASVSVWPALGTTVTLDDDTVITADGVVTTLTDEIRGLLRMGRLLTYDPTGQSGDDPPSTSLILRGWGVDVVTEDEYTIAVTDFERFKEFEADTGDIEVTVPAHADVPIPVDFQTHLVWAGAASSFTVIEGSGVTVEKSDTLFLRVRGSSAMLVKTALPDTWRLIGDTETA
jgi:hypothetical protein